MNAPSPSPQAPLIKLMTVATALSFGILAAIVASMKDFFGGDASMQFSYKTGLGFVLGAIAGWGLWVVARYFIRRSGDDA